MVKCALVLAVVTLFLANPMIVVAAMEHDGHGMHTMSGSAHEEVVDGVKATFFVQTMADAMKSMGMKMPMGIKETHHVSVVFKDSKSGKALTDGVAKIKIIGPDKTEQFKDMMSMQGHYGSDIDMSLKGSYGIMCKFQIKDGRTRQIKFWYTVK